MAKRRGLSRLPNEVWVEPPRAAQTEAHNALYVRQRLPAVRRAGTYVGLARARSIAAGKLQPAREVAAWFARHEGNVVNALMRGESMVTSKAIMAWKMWGGKPMRKAAEKAVLAHEKRRDRG